MVVSEACATDVLIVQSNRERAYYEVAKGFRSVVGQRCDPLVLADSEEKDLVRTIRNLRPRLIFAIGANALKKVLAMGDIPTVYAMVFNPEAKVAEGVDVTGVGMRLGPEHQLALIKHVLPRARKIGLLSDPDKTGPLTRQAIRGADEVGIDLVVRDVRQTRDVPGIIDGLKGMVHAFWLLPDSTVVSPQTLEYLQLVSVESRIPFIAFSDEYLKNGALMSVGIDPPDIGRQAGELAARILAGTLARNLPPVEPRRAKVHVNGKVARQLDIVIHQPSGTDVVVHR
ncbi:hypothetical protein PLCT2_00002 [Planctomycetaceae bacterium]|nr:hypothetical protein PLCT2_00002 [Planctomycetaceae bacterium]